MDGERNASRIVGQIRASIAATIKSSALKVDADAFASGVFLVAHDVNDDCREPRTVNAQARIYAPNATGNYIELWYENHHRVRMSFTERHSHLVASRGGPNMKLAHPYGRKEKKACEKIFDLDYNENRRKNQVKKSLASNATLASMSLHLFGSEGAVSNRKIFGLLVRSVGLGKFGELNGWPIAMARQRFKCGKGETETDTERIPGDKTSEANVGDCCVM